MESQVLFFINGRLITMEKVCEDEGAAFGRKDVGHANFRGKYFNTRNT